MHKLLSSPEILEEIFLYSSQHTHTVTARVCRLWFRHSIRLLWKTAELNNLLKVVSLFDHTDKSVNDISEQPLLPQSWDRFFLYSKNISSLKCFDINYAALKPVMYWRPPTVDLFSPRLTVVRWDGRGVYTKFFPFLLTSTLQRLYISLDNIQEPMADALCQTIATRSPYLRLFQLSISSTNDHGILSRSLGELLLHLSRLTVAVIPARFMTLELFIILSRLSNLKGLLMLSSIPNFIEPDFVKTLMGQKLMDDKTIKEFSPFYSLTDLFIYDNNSHKQTLTTSTLLNCGFQLLKLTHLVCSPFTKISEESEIISLMELVHSVCPILKIITIKRPSGSSSRLPWQAIQALLKCPRLRTLEVFGRTIDMGLNDMLTVATNRSSWQSINLPSTQPLSYEALIFFAQKCPELGKLGLMLDNVSLGLPNLDTSFNKTDILFSSLHTLNVGDSPIASPVNVGLFLSQLCGNALKVNSSEGKYTQSWKTVADIVDSMNSTARVRILNKEVSELRETVAKLKGLKKKRINSPEFKIKVKNES